MFTSIHFKNFKCLRDATLPLGRFTLLVGANGSGKSTALEGIGCLATPKNYYERLLSVGSQAEATIDVSAVWESGRTRVELLTRIVRGGCDALQEIPRKTVAAPAVISVLKDFACYAFDATQLSQPFQVHTGARLDRTGRYIAAVLDRFRDTDRERFRQFEAALASWLPEFDEVQFLVPDAGQKSFALRQRETKASIPAASLSQGTLLAVAYLTLAYLPNPPQFVAFEEPDSGLHPRLLGKVQEALFRLAYPEEYGESRPPVQVIATTHNPYFVDLFKDRPEDIVIANKPGVDATFERISDREHWREIIEGAPLGELWYSGILGGVPANG